MGAQTQHTIERRVEEFSTRPGPRYRWQGSNSGEQFFEECLCEWFEEALFLDKRLNVVLDGVDGYLASFLDEAFGRLVRHCGRDVIEKHLNVISSKEPQWIDMLQDKTFPNWMM